MQAHQNVTETRILMSDPTALGVFGLAMVTFVAASQKMGWTTGVTYLIPWALFLGSIAQVWASSVDFKKNNYFGAIVLGAYGLFWSAVGIHWAISLGWFGAVGDKADPRQLAFACFGYTVFSLFIMVAAFEALHVPPAALERGGVEILRAVVVDGALHVSLRPAFDDPQAWGMLLADVLKIVAQVGELVL